MEAVNIKPNNFKLHLAYASAFWQTPHSCECSNWLNVI